MSRKNDSPGVMLSQLPEPLRLSIEPILEHVSHGAGTFVDLSQINTYLEPDITVTGVIRGLRSAGFIVVRHYLKHGDEPSQLVGLHIVSK